MKEELKKYIFRNTNKLLIPNEIMVKALKDSFKEGVEKIKKDIDNIKEDLKCPSSATESERVLMKQTVNIFANKLKLKIAEEK